MIFGIIGNTDKPAVGEVMQNLLAYLQSRKMPFVVHGDLARWYAKGRFTPRIERSVVIPENRLADACDILISLGGDGTMLAAARIIGDKGKPILGVNLGKLGFLAEVSVEELYDCLDDILEGRYDVEERLVVEATVKGKKRRYLALNEIVLDRGESARVIELETSVNGEYLVTYAADGIIVNTPTGSTGYSLATGGPIVTPRSNVLTINPISPHTLTARPVIVPDDSVVKIIVHSSARPVHITADGQIEDFYETPAEFTVRRAPYTVKLVKSTRRTYYDLLRTKLLWGRDVRIVNP